MASLERRSTPGTAFRLPPDGPSAIFPFDSALGGDVAVGELSDFSDENVV